MNEKGLVAIFFFGAFFAGATIGAGVRGLVDDSSSEDSPDWATVPACPGAGIPHHQTPGHSRDVYSAYLAQGWTNVTYVTEQYGGLFGSGELYMTQADCPIVVVDKTGGAE